MNKFNFNDFSRKLIYTVYSIIVLLVTFDKKYKTFSCIIITRSERKDIPQVQFCGGIDTNIFRTKCNQGTVG